MEATDQPYRPTEPDLELHKRNIEFLANRFPQCKPLVNYIPQTELKFLDNGEPTVMLGEKSLYDEMGAYAYADEQVETYWKSPARITIPPPTGRGLDDYTNAFLQALLKGVTEQELIVYERVQTRLSDHVNVFGVGLGAHLNALLEDTRCHTMLLIEPNLEFIFQSTFVFDWVAFFDRAKELDCNVQLVSTMDSQMILYIIRDVEIIFA